MVLQVRNELPSLPPEEHQRHKDGARLAKLASQAGGRGYRPRTREIARKVQRSAQAEALEAIIHRGGLDPSCTSAAQSLQHLNRSLDVDFDDGIRLYKKWDSRREGR